MNNNMSEDAMAKDRPCPHDLGLYPICFCYTKCNSPAISLTVNFANERALLVIILELAISVQEYKRAVSWLYPLS